jgi:hypothetical protein
MLVFNEPIPIAEDDENAAFHYNEQLRQLFLAARSLQFTNGTITNNAKAGNFDAKWQVFTSNGTANTEDTVAHKLGRVPVGVFAGLPDKAAVLYKGTTAWTSTNIYLKTSVATVAWNIMVF